MPVEKEETNSLRELIQNLPGNMESNFVKLHEELYSLRQEMNRGKNNQFPNWEFS